MEIFILGAVIIAALATVDIGGKKKKPKKQNS